MIYVDTSVALAHLLAEDRYPPAALWSETLVSSRLLEYELWVRLHARRLAGSHGASAGALLGRIGFLELVSDVIGRARDPFPLPVRTLDALHLASLVFLTEQGQSVALASYDQRMLTVARKMGVDIYDLG